MTEDDEAVGYKSPPRSTRYRAGVSGNPKGRPKRKARLALRKDPRPQGYDQGRPRGAPSDG